MMDPVWETKYSQGHKQLYPWDTVVSFIYNNTPDNADKSNIKILELGFGTGSNLWFAAREGYSVYGIEGSKSAVNYAKKRFNQEGLKGNLLHQEFDVLPFSENYFDMVIDRAALTHVGLKVQEKIISQIHGCLKKGGKFMYNPYSTSHTSYKFASLYNDNLSINITSGNLINVGQVCFISENNINEIFSSDWSEYSSSHKKIIATYPEYNKHVHAEWIVEAEK